MANDYGSLLAISGLADGVNSFTNAYMTAKNLKHQQQMSELAAGVTKDENGNLVPTQEHQQAIQEKGMLAQRDKEKMDAGSHTSQAARGLARGIIGQQGKDSSFITDDMSASDLEENGLIGKAVQGQYNVLGQQARGNASNIPRQDANQMRASTDYDKVIGKNYEDRLDAANRVKDLIHKARTGELIPSENLGQQLATDINMLQSGHTSVSGTEHSRPNTLFGKGGQLAHFLSGDPKAALTDADLGQMEKETGYLYSDIGNQHKSKFAAWIKGQPKSVQQAMTSRFNEARSQYFPQGLMGAAGGGTQPTAAKPHPLDNAALAKAQSILSNPSSSAEDKALAQQVIQINGR